MFSSLTNGYEDLWKAIIRPPRDQYLVKELGKILEIVDYIQIGPTQFKVQGVRVKRTDMQLGNKQNLKLECSYFEPVEKPCQQLPCIIYLHGNSSSRMESLQCLEILLPQMICLFSFDFAGCGQSGGDYISLGWYERDDVEVVVDWLRKSEKVSTIGLWGRSMGAVTSLMHADRDPSIAGLVLDSPFSSLRTLAEELAKTYSKAPSLVLSGVMAMVRKTIQNKAKFDIDSLNPLENHVKKAFIPAMFVAGKQDQFINFEHTVRLHKAYAGDKNIILVDGDHNSSRPQFLMDSIGIFFYNALQVQYLVPEFKPKENGQDADFKDLNLNHIVRNIGNEYLVQGALGEMDDDSELMKAIEESLKLSGVTDQQVQQQQGQQPIQAQQPQQHPQQPPPKQPNFADLMSFSDDEKKK